MTSTPGNPPFGLYSMPPQALRKTRVSQNVLLNAALPGQATSQSGLQGITPPSAPHFGQDTFGQDALGGQFAGGQDSGRLNHPGAGSAGPSRTPFSDQSTGSGGLQTMPLTASLAYPGAPPLASTLPTAHATLTPAATQPGASERYQQPAITVHATQAAQAQAVQSATAKQPTSSPASKATGDKPDRLQQLNAFLDTPTGQVTAGAGVLAAVGGGVYGIYKAWGKNSDSTVVSQAPAGTLKTLSELVQHNINQLSTVEKIVLKGLITYYFALPPAAQADLLQRTELSSQMMHLPDFEKVMDKDIAKSTKNLLLIFNDTELKKIGKSWSDIFKECLSQINQKLPGEIQPAIEDFSTTIQSFFTLPENEQRYLIRSLMLSKHNNKGSMSFEDFLDKELWKGAINSVHTPSPELKAFSNRIEQTLNDTTLLLFAWAISDPDLQGEDLLKPIKVSLHQYPDSIIPLIEPFVSNTNILPARLSSDFPYFSMLFQKESLDPQIISNIKFKSDYMQDIQDIQEVLRLAHLFVDFANSDLDKKSKFASSISDALGKTNPDKLLNYLKNNNVKHNWEKICELLPLGQWNVVLGLQSNDFETFLNELPGESEQEKINLLKSLDSKSINVLTKHLNLGNPVGFSSAIFLTPFLPAKEILTTLEARCDELSELLQRVSENYSSVSGELFEELSSANLQERLPRIIDLITQRWIETYNTNPEAFDLSQVLTPTEEYSLPGEANALRSLFDMQVYPLRESVNLLITVLNPENTQENHYKKAKDLLEETVGEGNASTLINALFNEEQKLRPELQTTLNEIMDNTLKPLSNQLTELHDKISAKLVSN